MALMQRDPRVINDWTKGNRNDVPSMELYRLEKQSREDEDAALWRALRQEIADRIADVDAEEAARIAADNELWAALRKEIQDRIKDVDNEEADRKSADEMHRLASDPHPNLYLTTVRGMLPGTRVYCY